jgi:hypothetical protein
MANTRFKYDDCRTIKALQQATDPGRWILNVPGVAGGDKPCFMEDPQVIPQKWGGNLWTDTINLSSNLRGIGRQLTKGDCMLAASSDPAAAAAPIQYPLCGDLMTAQSRVTNPAWWYRDLEQTAWEYPPLNPQVNVCYPFENNTCTRIIEKDNFRPKRDCVMNNGMAELPVNFMEHRSIMRL